MDISTVDDELYARSIHFLLKFMTTHKMVYHAVWWTRLHRSWCEGDHPRLGIKLMSENMFLIVANLKNCITQPDTRHQPLHSKEFGCLPSHVRLSPSLSRPIIRLPYWKHVGKWLFSMLECRDIICGRLELTARKLLCRPPGLVGPNIKTRPRASSPFDHCRSLD